MIVVDWGNYNDTLLVIKFERSWTLDKQLRAMDAAYDLIRRNQHDVVMIYDMQRARQIPRNFSHAMYQYAYMQPDNVMISIVVSHSPVWEKLYSTSCYLYGFPPNANRVFVKDANHAYTLADVYLTQHSK